MSTSVEELVQKGGEKRFWNAHMEQVHTSNKAEQLLILFGKFYFSCSKIEFIIFTLIIRVMYWGIGLISRVFMNGPGDPGFNPWSSHTKDSKNGVLDGTLLNTQHYEVRIKHKVEQSRE